MTRSVMRVAAIMARGCETPEVRAEDMRALEADLAAEVVSVKSDLTS